MLTIDLHCGNVVLKSKTKVEDVKVFLEEYGFEVETTQHNIRFYKECEIFENVFGHVYIFFNIDTKIITSIMFIIYPIKFDLVQKKLTEKYGKPDSENEWKFADGKIEHEIFDRFGDMEKVYYSFY